MNIYFLKFAESFLIYLRTIAEINLKFKFVKYFFLFAKIGLMVFDLKKAFKQTKELILFQVKPSKKLFKKCFALFRVTVQIL